MKKLNIPLIPVITGTLALAAVIAVIIIVSGAGGSAGLYITDASGSVSITNSDNADSNAISGEALAEGDIITSGENSSCKIVYKSKKNSDNNYMILSPDSQLVITGKTDSKSGGEIYLNRGSLLCVLPESDKTQVFVRTADSMVYPSGTVTKIAYSTDGFDAYTDVYTFMGNSKIQLYDAQGNTVNDPEFLVEKRAGRITTNDLGPEFSYLNIEFPLSDLTARDLKNLITAANLLENFPYTANELKNAYNAAPDAEEEITGSSEEQTQDSSDIIQTAEAIDTSETASTTAPHVIEPPAATTAPPITTAATTAQSAQTTTAAQSSQTTTVSTTQSEATTSSEASHEGKMLTVVISVDGDETIQEVPYGGNADKPEDPVISGKKFIGWDNSFENITKDTIITALFEDDTTVYHTVTIVIADKITTIQVKDGDPAPLPDTLNIEGYIFKGWDTDYSRITSDVTITAILEKESNSVTVTFMISGLSYVQTIERGGTAIPPFTPTTDINGNEFIGWDKSLTNITSDTTITAIFGKEEYTVTFVIDGVEYPVKVKGGEDAMPPFTPTYDSKGRSFIGWDGNFYAIHCDMVITAIFI